MRWKKKTKLPDDLEFAMFSPKVLQEIFSNGSEAACKMVNFLIVYGAETGELTMTQKEIADITGSSLRTIQTGISELKKINAIAKVGGVTYINPKLVCTGNRKIAESNWRKMFTTLTIDYRFQEK